MQHNVQEPSHQPENGWHRCRHELPIRGDQDGKLCGQPVTQAPNGINYPYCKKHAKMAIDIVTLNRIGFDTSHLTDDIKSMKASVEARTGEKQVRMGSRVLMLENTDEVLEKEGRFDSSEVKRKLSFEEEIDLLKTENKELKLRLSRLEELVLYGGKD